MSVQPYTYGQFLTTCSLPILHHVHLPMLITGHNHQLFQSLLLQELSGGAVSAQAQLVHMRNLVHNTYPGYFLSPVQNILGTHTTAQVPFHVAPRNCLCICKTSSTVWIGYISFGPMGDTDHTTLGYTRGVRVMSTAARGHI